jgi:glycerol uptake facilitator-like aquaporin
MQTTLKQVRRISASGVVIVAAAVMVLGALDVLLEPARFWGLTFLLFYCGQYLVCRVLGVSAFIGPMEIKGTDDYSHRWIPDAVGILGYVFAAVLMVFVR